MAGECQAATSLENPAIVVYSTFVDNFLNIVGDAVATHVLRFIQLKMRLVICHVPL